MQISGITMVNFMSHEKTDVGLPDRGLVLVTGPNGAGKSSLIEAVSYAGWCKTLRKTPPWPEGKAGMLVVETPDLVIRRKKSASKPNIKLQWMGPGDAKLRKYERNTEAQRELEAQLGSWDTWKRTCVFSSADAAHFTLATDGERKKLLEVVLGLERFDAALEACRADLRAAQERLQAATMLVTRHTIQRDEAKKRLEDARTTLADLPAPTGVSKADLNTKKEQVEQLERTVVAGRDTMRELLAEMNDLTILSEQARQKALTADKALQRLLDKTCPTCTQEITTETRARFETAAAAAKEKADADLKILHKRGDALDEALLDLNERCELVSAELKEAQSAYDRQCILADGEVAMVRLREAAEKRAQSAKNDLTAAETSLKTAAAEVAAADKRHQTLQCAEKVLGLRGVRAQILSKTLSGIEAVANFWLAKITGKNLSLQLRPYKEKAKGGVIDAISLEVTGAGEGYGYKASSGGERRRIDIALLMALAEISQAAIGTNTPSTLFMDEVFDALDTEGSEAVADALAELCRTRTVVVISHSSTFMQRLQPTLHLHVEQGTITKL